GRRCRRCCGGCWAARCGRPTGRSKRYERMNVPKPPGRRFLATAGVVLGLVSVTTSLRGELPPLTPEDWAAKPPASDAHASTLMLFKRAELQLMDLTRQQLSSSLREEVRLKVLDRRGLERGELEIRHSSYLRLKSLSGRTRLSD